MYNVASVKGQEVGGRLLFLHGSFYLVLLFFCYLFLISVFLFLVFCCFRLKLAMSIYIVAYLVVIALKNMSRVIHKKKNELSFILCTLLF